MPDNNTTIWAVRAGAAGEADAIFLQQNLLAIGWPRIGDLDKLPPTRDGIRAALEIAYPDNKLGWYPIATGQLYRFRHEISEGDLVVYPSKRDKLIHIGELGTPSGYRFDPAINADYPNVRPVTWRKAVPRTVFTQGALYELNSALSVFKIQNYAGEIYKALGAADTTGSVVSGVRSTVVPATGAAPPLLGATDATTVSDDDSTITSTSAEIEENTRVFILKTLERELKGHPLAGFVAHLLGTMGFRTHVTPPGPDAGLDILAHKDDLGFEPPIVKVQVKSTTGSVGALDVQALYGTIQHGEFGLFVTLGTFTRDALIFARGKSNLRLIDGSQLVEHVLAHYEEFDSRYKGILPLRRVYVPAALDE